MRRRSRPRRRRPGPPQHHAAAEGGRPDLVAVASHPRRTPEAGSHGGNHFSPTCAYHGRGALVSGPLRHASAPSLLSPGFFVASAMPAAATSARTELFMHGRHISCGGVMHRVTRAGRVLAGREHDYDRLVPAHCVLVTPAGQRSFRRPTSSTLPSTTFVPKIRPQSDSSGACTSLCRPGGDGPDQEPLLVGLIRGEAMTGVFDGFLCPHCPRK
jgi:hypothetical protein